MAVLSIHHVSLVVSNTRQSVEFYTHLLDLSVNNQRPELSFSGAWLDIGNQQIHLLEVDNPDPVENRPEHGGRDRHLALTVDNIVEIEQRLINMAVQYTKSKSGRAALFCRDLDGNTLELIQQS